MSIDYYVYLKHINTFSSQSFEQYCRSLGLNIKLHPAFNLLEDTGFLPIRLIDERFDMDGGGCDFLSGFELYPFEYHHITQSQKKTLGFFPKMFKTKPVQELPFDRAIKDAAWLIELHCSNADSFEVLLACVFGAYLVKSYLGVFDDPQTGRCYDDYHHLENDIAAIIAELQKLKKPTNCVRTNSKSGHKVPLCLLHQ